MRIGLSWSALCEAANCAVERTRLRRAAHCKHSIDVDPLLNAQLTGFAIGESSTALAGRLARLGRGGGGGGREGGRAR